MMSSTMAAPAMIRPRLTQVMAFESLDGASGSATSSNTSSGRMVVSDSGSGPITVVSAGLPSGVSGSGGSITVVGASNPAGGMDSSVWVMSGTMSMGCSGSCSVGMFFRPRRLRGLRSCLAGLSSSCVSSCRESIHSRSSRSESDGVNWSNRLGCSLLIAVLSTFEHVVELVEHTVAMVEHVGGVTVHEPVQPFGQIVLHVDGAWLVGVVEPAASVFAEDAPSLVDEIGEARRSSSVSGQWSVPWSRVSLTARRDSDGRRRSRLDRSRVVYVQGGARIRSSSFLAAARCSGLWSMA